MLNHSVFYLQQQIRNCQSDRKVIFHCEFLWKWGICRFCWELKRRCSIFTKICNPGKWIKRENKHLMKLHISDQVFWRGTIKIDKKKVNMHAGNWFDNRQLSSINAVHFLYGWVHEQTSIKWCNCGKKFTADALKRQYTFKLLGSPVKT
jgi:hypothetical protein